MNVEDMRKTALYRSIFYITLIAVICILFTPASKHYSDDYILVTLLRFSFLINIYLLLRHSVPQIQHINKQLLLKCQQQGLTLPQ